MRICCEVCFIGVMALVYLSFATFSYIWIPVVMDHCHEPPGIVLENLSIRNITMYQSNNATSSTPYMPLGVNSKLNVTFSMCNRNSVAKCFTTYRTMDEDVRFKNYLIVRQRVPLGFSLKPKHERQVQMDLKGVHFLLQKDLGPVLEAELQSGNVTLEFFLNTRYLIADRSSAWKRCECLVVAKSPPVETPVWEPWSAKIALTFDFSVTARVFFSSYLVLRWLPKMLNCTDGPRRP